jgi:predicted ester cyclase
MVKLTAIAVLILSCPATHAAGEKGNAAHLPEVEQTMLDAEKSLSRRALNMWAGGNSDDPKAIFTENYINHQEPSAGGGVKAIDLAAWLAIVESNHRAFPDLRVEILMQIVEGDKVATHWRFTGSQQGDYEGLPPTGKRVSWTGVQIDRFENGKIVESWVSWDKYTQFEELGLLE